MMKRLPVVLAAAGLLLCVPSPVVLAGTVITPGTSVNVRVTDDPAAANFNGSVTPSASGPTTFDNGRLTLTETIIPVNSSTAWAVFHINATTGNVLAGNSSAHFNITISGIQTAKAALAQFFTGFDVNGTPDPFLFPGTTIGPNPISGTGSVANGIVSSSSYTFSTSQQLFADLNPFDDGPKDFGNSPSNTPTGFTIGGRYVLQHAAVPEPGSLTLAGLAAAGAAFRTLRRRRSHK